jgi:yeast amino acid transporter
MNVSNSASTVFNYLSSLSSITGLITWGCILFSYLRFYYGCKQQGIDRREFPYVAPLQPYASYAGLILVILVIFFNGYTLFLSDQWDTTT